MENIFIIIENPSDYDSEIDIIGFSTTKEEDNKICYTLNYFYQELDKFHKGLNEKLNPLISSDIIGLEAIIPIPKWDSGLSATSITDDMRALRDEIIDKNKAIIERNRLKANTRTEEIIKAVAEIVGGLDESKELNKYIKSNINEYGMMKKHLNLYSNQEIKKL